MKRKIVFVCSVILIVFCTSALKEPDADSPPKNAATAFLNEKTILEKKVNALSSLLNSSEKISQVNKDSIKAKLLACRLVYKKMEWALSYYYPSIATRINGTDVIEEEEPTEFEPAHGLQTIENIALGAVPEAKAVRLKDELRRLVAEINLLDESIRQLKGSTNGEMLAALKYELIKVTVTGFTEYDNPVMKNYLKESSVALLSVRDNLKLFNAHVSAALIDKTDKLFTSATDYIKKNNNLDRFDRMEFIMNYYKPLSKLVDEYSAEMNTNYTSYNPNINLSARSIFDLVSFNYFFADADKNTHAARVMLGKNLFFDPVLSGNGKRACASCHKPGKAFTDGLAKSIAFNENEMVARSAPTILNSCLQMSFFDDSRKATLETQLTEVINNPKELNGNFPKIIATLKKSKEYVKMFAEAFPNDTLSATDIKVAIADYERTLVSFNSDFDKYINGDKASMTSSQISGFNLFMGKARCGSCHFLPLFNGMIPPLYNKSEFEIVGALKTNDFKHPELDADEGVGPIKNAEHLKFGFKVPGLRNAAITAPYMHNGAMKTLEDVITFYNKGGAVGFGMNLPNQTLASDSLGLSKKQINDIIHFIQSLNDTTLLTSAPMVLPKLSENEQPNARMVGGEY
jgi:cytochrome c peroxidase